MTMPVQLPTPDIFTEVSPHATDSATAASREDGPVWANAPTADIALAVVIDPPQLSFSPTLVAPAKSSSWGSSSVPGTPNAPSEGPAARSTSGLVPLVPPPPTT